MTVTENILDLRQINVTILDPIIENEKRVIVGNSIVISNIGDDDVVINRGLTIASGKAIEFKTGEDGNVIVLDFSFIFEGSGVNPKVEVIVSMPDGPEYVNYETL